MKRKSTCKRSAYSFRTKNKKATDIHFGRWLFLAIVCSLMIGVQSAEEGPLLSVQKELSRLIQQIAGVDEAIETLGRKFSDGRSDREHSLLVFGRMILGLEEEIPDIQEQEKSEGISDVKSSVYHAESAVPILNTVQLAEELSAVEIDDSTENIPFKIPSPDIVDDAAYVPKESFCLPLRNYRVTSRFGYRIHPISGNTTFHYGADLAASTGTKIVSVGDGKVKETGYGSINGNYVKIDHADGYTSHYTHLHEIDVKKGQNIKQGEKIGTVGSTGYSTGPHLHFELRHDGKVLDPFAYFHF